MHFPQTVQSDSYAVHVALHDFNDKGNYKWCKGNYSLPLRKDASLKINKYMGDGISSGNCATLQVVGIDETNLVYEDCDSSLNYICEVRMGDKKG
jgi:hypothetical protein